jgi:hypothetical protein
MNSTTCRFDYGLPRRLRSMTKKLLEVVLPLRSLTRKGALEKIKYIFERNNIAHQSHRKKQVSIAKELGVQMSL